MKEDFGSTAASDKQAVPCATSSVNASGQQAYQALADARKLIEKRDNWWSGREPLERHKFCAMWALDEAMGLSWGRLAEDYLRFAMGGRIAAFNDSHTHSEVLAAFDKAIALAQSASTEGPSGLAQRE